MAATAAGVEGDHPLVAAMVGGVVVEDGPQFGGRSHGQVGVAFTVHRLLELQRGRELRVVQGSGVDDPHGPSVMADIMDAGTRRRFRSRR